MNDEIRKSRYHHGDLPAALIDAAVELIEEKGIAGLTLREVARRVGVTHAAPYRHFKDKSALVAAVAEEGFRRITDRIARDSASLPDCGRIYLEFAVAHPEHFRVMFGSAALRARTASLNEAYEQLMEQLRLAVRRAESSSIVAAGDIDARTRLLWAQWHGLASLVVSGHTSKPERELDDHFAMLLAGIGPPSTSPPSTSPP